MRSFGCKSVQSLVWCEHFKPIPDCRVNRTKGHDLVDVLVIAVCCQLCGGDGFSNMEGFGKAKFEWFQTFLKLRNGIPSHDTFNRVISALDPKEFVGCFLRWTQGLRQTIPQEIVALDGKALRRATSGKAGAKYMVSAWAESNGLVADECAEEESCCCSLIRPQSEVEVL